MDFTVQNEGSIIIIHANTKAARTWINENVSESGYQPDFPNSIIVEPRYAMDLLTGIKEAGFTIGSDNGTLNHRSS
jgi:hypothetical protein